MDWRSYVICWPSSQFVESIIFAIHRQAPATHRWFQKRTTVWRGSPNCGFYWWSLFPSAAWALSSVSIVKENGVVPEENSEVCVPCLLIQSSCSDTICAAVLARFGEADAVVLITAFSSAATTWSEFVDAGSKVERYTRAVRTMSQLVNWWKHLSEVEKASTENISELVVQTEQAISKEQTNWLPSQAMGRADNHASASDVSRSNDPKNAERVKLSETIGWATHLTHLFHWSLTMPQKKMRAIETAVLDVGCYGSFL